MRNFWNEFIVTLCTWTTALVIVNGLWTTLAMAQDDCEELRLACQMKRQLGEQGAGNCKKYRACQAQQRGELRSACMHKRELGEAGQGNCRRYRKMCRR